MAKIDLIALLINKSIMGSTPQVQLLLMSTGMQIKLINNRFHEKDSKCHYHRANKKHQDLNSFDLPKSTLKQFRKRNCSPFRIETHILV